MPAQAIDNIQELKDQVLDKQDTLLSKSEVKKLNDISADTYETMKDDISSHQVNWQGESFPVSEFVKKIGSDGKVRISLDDKGDYIKRGSELGAWVQVFLISQGYDVVKNNQLSGSVDGKLGRFTHKAISMYKGDARNREDIDKNREDIDKNREDIDLNKAGVVLNEYGIRKNIEKINEKVLSDIKQRLQGATEYTKGWENPIKVNIIDETKPFVVSVENYGKKTIVDLEKGTLNFEGKVFHWFTSRKMDMVDGKINIQATSDDNQKLLEDVYKQAGMLNYIFGKFLHLKENRAGMYLPPSYGKINLESAKSDNPFYFNGVSIGGSKAGINFDNGAVRDTDIISSKDLRNIGIDFDKMHEEIPNVLNEIYQSYKKQNN